MQSTQTAAPLLTEAQREMNAKVQSTYQHTIYVDESQGIFNFDCSGFIDYMLSRVAPQAYTELPTSSSSRPLAKDFYNFFASLTQSNKSNNWQSVERPADLQPGDIVSWLQSPDSDSTNTGHMMVVGQAPTLNPQDPQEWLIPVYDSTMSPHAQDSRASGETGLGSGVLGILTDAQGLPTAYRWRGGLSKTVVTTPISFGRLTNNLPPPTLSLTKALGGAGRIGNDQFTVQVKNGAGAVVNSTASSTTSGAGTVITAGTGTTGTLSLIAGQPYTLLETMAAGSASKLAQYSQALDCVNTLSVAEGGTDLSGIRRTGDTVTLRSGDAVSCILTNTPKPTLDLSVTKSDRVGSVYQNGTSVYTIVVKNNGPAEATAIITDPAVAGLTKVQTACSATPGLCTVPPDIAALEGSGFVTPSLPSGATFEFTVSARMTASTGTIKNVVSVAAPSDFYDTNAANNTATDTNTAAGTPPSCTTTITGLFYTSSGTWTTLTPIDRTTTPYTKGPLIGYVPLTSQTSNGNTALAVSPDGSKYYVPTADDGLKIYDVTQGTWTKVPYPAGVAKNPLRAAVTPDGTLYFGYGNLIWGYTAAGFTSKTLSFKDSSGLTPAPTLFGSGDFVSDASGNLYLISDVSNTAAIDIFKINPVTGNVVFVGRIAGSAVSSTTTYNGVAALSDGLYVGASSGQILKLDLANLTATEVSVMVNSNSYDLASCYYPVLQPQLSAQKTVTKVGGSAGAVQVGDTLEYTIVLRNSGTLNAGNTTFQDAVPAGTTYVPNSTTMNFVAVPDRSGSLPFATAWPVNSPGAGSGVIEIDHTPATQTSSSTTPDDNEVVIQFRVTVNAGSSFVSNQGTVTYADAPALLTDDPAVPGATDPTVVTVLSTTGLKVTKAVDSRYVRVMAAPDNDTALTLVPTQLRYTLTVSNSSAAPMTNVVIQDTLPAGLTFVSAVGNPALATPATVSGQNVTMTLPSLPSGATQTIELLTNVSVTPNTPQRQLSNTATAQADNVAQTSTPPALTDWIYPKLQKTVQNVNLSGSAPSLTRADGRPGDVLEYCLLYSNYGSVALPAFTLTDSVPLNTAAQVDAYGAGMGILLSRNAVSSKLTSAADNDDGSLSTSGGQAGQGLFTMKLGSLAPAETGNVCFRVGIR